MSPFPLLVIHWGAGVVVRSFATVVIFRRLDDDFLLTLSVDLSYVRLNRHRY